MPSSLTTVFSRVLIYSTHPPVSVYGTGSLMINPRSFSRKFELVLHLTSRFSWYGFAYTTRSNNFRLSHLSRQPILLCHSISHYTGTRISTSYPSATLFSLTLGPDLPRADEPAPGNLGFMTDMILTCLFVTHTGILTSCHSTSPSDLASPLQERSPTT